ncbi:class I SAM-dependent methyltransferase [Nonomuraea harbinensis]|uniref:Class I SAM-dependent methyltransferase n=1 Tax=Nonomuraea harbinensis TaxID=1286938 RepID=A0ABW1C8Y6_9ACTN|nr:class I SAM-dependent methyltransferase [Nonomuraea harbinensis]
MPGQLGRRQPAGVGDQQRGVHPCGHPRHVRSLVHDDWARSFLSDHPDTVVLHLGCGLDARVHRIDPPATVDWYDGDYPAVIELRRRFLPPRCHCTLVGADVTDLTWLDRVPRGRPVLVIAKGLVPYLTEKDVHRLLTGVVDAFPTGQIQIDTVPVWAWRTSKWDPALRKYDARFHCGFDVPAALAAWHPRLEYVDEVPMYDAPILRAKAPARIRRLYRVMNLVPGMKRSTRIVRFRFRETPAWPRP